MTIGRGQGIRSGLRAWSDGSSSLLRDLPMAVAVIDADGIVRQWNPAAESLTGFAHDDVLGATLPASLWPAGRPRPLGRLMTRLAEAPLRPVWHVRSQARSGRSMVLELTFAPQRRRRGRTPAAIVTAVDVTEQRQREREWKFQANHDSMTHLPNVDMLAEKMERALVAGTLSGEKTGLLMLDIEKFKAINSGLSRSVGDRLLAQIGPRLVRSTIRPRDLVARISGDKFGVLLPGVESLPTAIEVAERMLSSLQVPFMVDGRRVDLSASIGIAVAPEHGDEVTELFQHAETAMYEAKDASADIAVYRPDLENKATQRFGLVGQVRRALDRRELVVHYQPKVDVVSGAWAGTEALVRWQHPTRGLLSPAEFMPMVETTALINRVTAYVLDEALQQVSRWAADGLRVPVSVNLSARNLHDNTLPSKVLAALARHQVPAELLCLEITETAIMHDPEAAMVVLEEFVHAGVTLSLDDFGTGYSSMSYLQRLPVSELKVDRTFVAGIVRADADRALVRLAIDLGHSMGLHVVAEGVEDAEILRELQRLGCDVAQGYYFARPMSAADVSAWFAGRERLATALPPQSRRGSVSPAHSTTVAV